MNDSERNRCQRILAILTLGILESLADGVISVYEAERLLFSPNTLRFCREKALSTRLYAIIENGTNLDTTGRLLGHDKLKEVIAEMRVGVRTLLDETEESDSQLNHWIPQAFM